MQQIELDSISKRFEEHLKIEKNYRIILSGRFGLGKTFFLKEFFKERNKNYNTFFITPVNYVVNSNEDIFELIKIDLIRQLFVDEKQNNKKLSKASTIAHFASEKPHHFLKFVTSSFKKINPFIEIADNLYDGLNKLYSEYKKYEKELEDKLELADDKLREFANSFSDKVGNIFEENFITKKLTEKLSEMKKGKKKNVLIIDDLDRVDPEHIFRILNILSAHNNYIGTENKFAFDYIIVVCDILNIKNIFYHKYGSRVDFEGYIDKFYSTDIFIYKNDDALKFYLKNTFKRENEVPGFIETIIFILQELVDQEKLNVRQIIKHTYNVDIEYGILYSQSGLNEKNVHLRSEPAFIRNWDNFYFDSNDLTILRIFKLMSIIYGDFNDFYKHLEKLSTVKNKVNFNDLENIISFLTLQSHISSTTSDKLLFQLIYGDNYRGQNSLIDLDQPFIKLFDESYRIQLHWNRSRPYDASKSYFHNSKVINTNNHQYLGNRPIKNISKSEIFNLIKTIIINCQERGYLYKAGIIFNANSEN